MLKGEKRIPEGSEFNANEVLDGIASKWGKQVSILTKAQYYFEVLKSHPKIALRIIETKLPMDEITNPVLKLQVSALHLRILRKYAKSLVCIRQDAHGVFQKLTNLCFDLEKRVDSEKIDGQLWSAYLLEICKAYSLADLSGFADGDENLTVRAVRLLEKLRKCLPPI